MKDLIDTGLGFNDVCPITGTHKYFISKTIETFERIPAIDITEYDGMTYEQSDAINEYMAKYPLYRKVEQAILGCNCGSAVMKEIERV